MLGVRFGIGITCLIAACGVIGQGGFTIVGELEGIKSNTTIFLLDAESNPIDSTVVLNGHFTFTGKVDEVSKYFILIKETMDFQTIWIEPGTIKVQAKTGRFGQSKISGSKTQEYQDILNKRVSEVDQLYAEVNRIHFQRYYAHPDSVFTDSIPKVYARGEKERMKAIKSFIIEYPNTIASVNVLNDNKTIFKKKVTASLFGLMNSDYQRSAFGNKIQAYIDLSINIEIGDQYINFEQIDQNGSLLKLSESLGKRFTLLEFWASWCGPCRTSNPGLVKLYHKYKKEGFEIVGVSLDTERDGWINAIKQDGLPWKNVSDLKGYQNEVALTYSVASLPNSILIDEEGKIIAIGLRDGHLEVKLRNLFGY